MAIGKASDFKIYQEEFFGGLVEFQMQNGEAFNQASNNTISMVTNLHRGDYEKESFLKEISSLVTRRDTTSTGTATDLAMTQDEVVAVKLARKIGPVAQTLDAWKKISTDPQEMSFLLGRQSGKAVLLDKLNSSIKATVNAVRNAAVIYDATGQSTKTVTHTHLASVLAMFGDNAQNIRAWVMHSKPWFDLLKQGIADKITNIADGAIMIGNIPALGRPVIISDCADLKVAGTPDTYFTLGLVEGAVTVMDSEEENVESAIVTGLENLVMRIQGEHAYTIRIKGYRWDTSGGGANPDGTALGTGTNWVKVATDFKSTAGVRLKSE